MEHYGKNNLFIVNVNHAFDAFLQKCDFMEALPGGIAQFTGMTASIIQDVYRIDLDDDIKCVMCEMDSKHIPSDEEVGPSHVKQECGFNEEELKELVKGVHTKQKQKKANKENVDCEAQVDQLLMKVCDGDIADKMISGDFWLALVDALKQDEKEL